MLTDLHHISLIVKDMDESLSLYQDILGMVVERDTGPQGLEPYYAQYVSRVTGIPCSNVRIVYLKGFRIRLELQQFFGVENKMFEFDSRGIRNHIAFIVDDIHHAYNLLKQKGMHFISPPVRIPGGPLKNGFAVYFTDPSGNQIELIQRPKSYSSSKNNTKFSNRSNREESTHSSS